MDRSNCKSLFSPANKLSTAGLGIGGVDGRHAGCGWLRRGGLPLRGVKIVIEGGGLGADGGEILLGGVQVARGYLGGEGDGGRASKFWRDEEGVKWFRTGDLGRWKEGGGLEVLGRLDSQVAHTVSSLVSSV